MLVAYTTQLERWRQKVWRRIQTVVVANILQSLMKFLANPAVLVTSLETVHLSLINSSFLWVFFFSSKSLDLFSLQIFILLSFVWSLLIAYVDLWNSLNFSFFHAKFIGFEYSSIRGTLILYWNDTFSSSYNYLLFFPPPLQYVYSKTQFTDLTWQEKWYLMS